jgi:L-cystine uptake protein TcyP (sodium:dicarboxylate symporter family)
MESVAVLIVIFGTFFGIAYLFFSTRNKERMSLIEKGVDASIFMKGREKNAAPFWKVLILNLGLLAMGIGVGVLLGALLSYNFGFNGSYSDRPSNYIQTETFYLASIFLCAGASLLIGFNITKKLDKE